MKIWSNELILISFSQTMSDCWFLKLLFSLRERKKHEFFQNNYGQKLIFSLFSTSYVQWKQSQYRKTKFYKLKRLRNITNMYYNYDELNLSMTLKFWIPKKEKFSRVRGGLSRVQRVCASRIFCADRGSVIVGTK